MRDRRLGWMGLGRAALLVGLITGCESDRDQPAAGTPPMPEEMPQIALVLPTELTTELGLLERAALMAAGQDRVIFSVERPQPGESAEVGPAERLRESVRRGAAVVIVVTGAAVSSELIDAVREVRQTGTRVVALGGSPGLAEAATTSLVPAEPGPPARELLQALKRKLEESNGPAKEGPIVLLVPESQADEVANARQAALKEAIDQVGWSQRAVEVRIPAAEEAYDALKSAIATAPEPAVVLALNHADLSGAIRLRAERVEARGPDFLVGGFSEDPLIRDELERGRCTAAVEISAARLGAEAVQVAVRLTRNEPVPDRVAVPLAVRVTRVLMPSSPRSPTPEGNSPARPPGPDEAKSKKSS